MLLNRETRFCPFFLTKNEYLIEEYSLGFVAHAHEVFSKWNCLIKSNTSEFHFGIDVE